MRELRTHSPAFPCANDAEKTYNWIYRGMTTRDYFAAKAMEGMLAASSNLENYEVAEQAYEIADAMLIQRERP